MDQIKGESRTFVWYDEFADLPTDDGWNDLEPGQAPSQYDTREEEALDQ